MRVLSKPGDSQQPSGARSLQTWMVSQGLTFKTVSQVASLRRRYCSASARCAAITSASARSAMVRATWSTRWNARAESRPAAMQWLGFISHQQVFRSVHSCSAVRDMQPGWEVREQTAPIPRPRATLRRGASVHSRSPHDRHCLGLVVQVMCGNQPRIGPTASDILGATTYADTEDTVECAACARSQARRHAREGRTTHHHTDWLWGSRERHPDRVVRPLCRGGQPLHRRAEPALLRRLLPVGAGAAPYYGAPLAVLESRRAAGHRGRPGALGARTRDRTAVCGVGARPRLRPRPRPRPVWPEGGSRAGQGAYGFAHVLTPGLSGPAISQLPNPIPSIRWASWRLAWWG
jgi:hypothetical protein